MTASAHRAIASNIHFYQIVGIKAKTRPEPPPQQEFLTASKNAMAENKTTEGAPQGDSIEAEPKEAVG